MIKSAASAKGDWTVVKPKVLEIVEQKNIGYWHLAEQVVELEGVLKNIPQYVK